MLVDHGHGVLQNLRRAVAILMQRELGLVIYEAGTAGIRADRGRPRREGRADEQLPELPARSAACEFWLVDGRGLGAGRLGSGGNRGGRVSGARRERCFRARLERVTAHDLAVFA